MMKVLKFVLAAAFAVMASANFVAADDKAKEPLVLESKISKDGKADPCMGACKINFRTELKVPFDYLDGLGYASTTLVKFQIRLSLRLAHAALGSRKR